MSKQFKIHLQKNIDPAFATRSALLYGWLSRLIRIEASGDHQDKIIWNVKVYGPQLNKEILA